MIKEHIYIDETWLHNIYMDALKFENRYQESLDYFESLQPKDYDEVTFCILYDTLCWNEDLYLLLEFHEKVEEYASMFSENTYNSMI